ncbi:hypothetical protein [Nitratireductor sp. ZSWI3]|uniref:hypothetical protein n=1 Tax=Nitratireductor sp. ZSWI3 TaxID=2966359 RepID=UPI00214F6CDC|nr:hypothetical protein [Nitratireductor sp. ZSWI3]MCR4267170.1 hypothetical protein [Nitratireductor sp. ZSWI3]
MPMERIRKIASVCIGRAVMFGSLAIGMIMLSFSFDLVLALKAGAILALIMAQILIIKAYTTPRQNPRRTEVWSYLSPELRPMGNAGAKVFLSILSEVYLLFASRSLAVGCGFFTASVTLYLLRAVE